MNTRIILIIALLISCFANEYLFAADWVLARQETFDQDGQLNDQSLFGDRDWLTASIRNSGSIVVSGGRALISTPNFPDSALIRIAPSLPNEYRLRVRVGNVHYSTSNYEQADYDDPDFKYSLSWVENGFYWLTLTDRLVESDSGEDWWHRYRKIVIDSDDHTGVTRPLYMVYMNPDLDRSSGNWLNGQAELLRCWSAGTWHTETWNWVAALTYAEDTNYEVEIEKFEGQLIMRAFDSSGTLIEETDPVDLNLIYGMGDGITGSEYAYFGEPHIDSYEGDAWVDDIRLWVINTAPIITTSENQYANIDEPFSLYVEAQDTTFLDSFSFSSSGLPSGASFNGETGLLTWTPSVEQKGVHSITFTAQDEHGASNSKIINITVGDFSTALFTVGGGCGRIHGGSNFFAFPFVAFFALLMLRARRNFSS